MMLCHHDGDAKHGMTLLVPCPAALPFLVRGGYTSAKGTLVGGLDPWPSDTLPADSCRAPTITFDPLSASSGAYSPPRDQLALHLLVDEQLDGSSVA
jgi:hypothetical protein